MRKAVDLFVLVFPWFVLGVFIVDVFNFWNIDQERTLMAIVAAIGWASFLEVRNEYNNLKEMLEGKVKNES